MDAKLIEEMQKLESEASAAPWTDVEGRDYYFPNPLAYGDFPTFDYEVLCRERFDGNGDDNSTVCTKITIPADARLIALLRNNAKELLELAKSSLTRAELLRNDVMVHLVILLNLATTEGLRESVTKLIERIKANLEGE